MTTNHNHAEEIARDMYYTYQTSHNPFEKTDWEGLPEKEKKAWQKLASKILPIIGNHALEDIEKFLKDQAAASSGWKKSLYWIASIIAAGAAALGLFSLTGCGHSVDVTPDRTEVCKDGSCLVIEQGHLSYSQAQSETTVSPVVQPLKK